jgi:UDP-N-acetylglucosamine 2-epimerase (non-hydrolysing)
LKKDAVLHAVRVITAQHKQGGRAVPWVEDYAGGRVSEQVLRIVMSYVDYGNRTVWSKST